ncbi:hypothetical protein Ssi02_75110 [Sinosporangium siamense]|uniref:Uncharacterized protein n=1 Tax=Sinosporangium siamense TaxID=1367973 RepID=A0A919RQN5_9ACTN|nr:hypothetical protein Ssi02_75110 [Sinosporangium siamense]
MSSSIRRTTPRFTESRKGEEGDNLHLGAEKANPPHRQEARHTLGRAEADRVDRAARIRDAIDRRLAVLQSGTRDCVSAGQGGRSKLTTNLSPGPASSTEL